MSRQGELEVVFLPNPRFGRADVSHAPPDAGLITDTQHEKWQGEAGEKNRLGVHGKKPGEP